MSLVLSDRLLTEQISPSHMPRGFPCRKIDQWLLPLLFRLESTSSKVIARHCTICRANSSKHSTGSPTPLHRAHLLNTANLLSSRNRQWKYLNSTKLPAPLIQARSIHLQDSHHSTIRKSTLVLHPFSALSCFLLCPAPPFLHLLPS